jgi:4-hydroxy-tetrahydrodipicolinate reductase
MIKVIISGCNGAMGQVLTRTIAKYDDIEIVAGLDIASGKNDTYTVYTELEDIKAKTADIIVDFSHPSALGKVLKLAGREGIPTVLATTGYTEDQLIEIDEASRHIPVFRTANMSLGINLMIDLIKKASKVLDSGFDVEILEKHHNRKVDAPSGTAIMLANAINEDQPDKYEYVYERHSTREKRSAREIGIHAVRGGTIVGEHMVIFAGNDEIIEIKHSAASREVFAEGAVKAIRFMQGKPPGLYNMSDVIRGG